MLHNERGNEMTVQEAPRTSLDAAHAYVLPVVREVPAGAGAPTPSPTLRAIDASSHLPGSRAW
jgi:hypothetical protein